MYDRRIVFLVGDYRGGCCVMSNLTTASPLIAWSTASQEPCLRLVLTREGASVRGDGAIGRMGGWYDFPA